MKKTQFIFGALMTLAVGAAVIFAASWVKQRSKIVRLGDENARLVGENERLRKNLARTRGGDGPQISRSLFAERETATTDIEEPARVAPVASSNHARAPESGTNGLAMKGVEAHTVPEGLVAVMRFKQVRSGQPENLALVARLPPDAEAIILKLTPADSTMCSDVVERISENGKFAVFQGVPNEDAEDIAFSLLVSAPVTADVRGTHGIGMFQLKIGAEGASTSAY